MRDLTAALARIGRPVASRPWLAAVAILGPWLLAAGLVAWGK